MALETRPFAHVGKRLKGTAIPVRRNRFCPRGQNAPYVRGRLVITPLGDGRFTAEVTRGADKWAVRA